MLRSSGGHFESFIQVDSGFEWGIIANDKETIEDCSHEQRVYTNSRMMPEWTDDDNMMRTRLRVRGLISIDKEPTTPDPV